MIEDRKKERKKRRWIKGQEEKDGDAREALNWGKIKSTLRLSDLLYACTLKSQTTQVSQDTRVIPMQSDRAERDPSGSHCM